MDWWTYWRNQRQPTGADYWQQQYEALQQEQLARSQQLAQQAQHERDSKSLTGVIAGILGKPIDFTGDLITPAITKGFEGLEWYDRNVAGNVWNAAMGPAVMGLMGREWDESVTYENLGGKERFAAGAISDPLNYIPLVGWGGKALQGTRFARAGLMAEKGARFLDSAQVAGADKWLPPLARTTVFPAGRATGQGATALAKRFAPELFADFGRTMGRPTAGFLTTKSANDARAVLKNYVVRRGMEEGLGEDVSPVLAQKWIREGLEEAARWENEAAYLRKMGDTDGLTLHQKPQNVPYGGALQSLQGYVSGSYRQRGVRKRAAESLRRMMRRGPGAAVGGVSEEQLDQIDDIVRSYATKTITPLAAVSDTVRIFMGDDEADNLLALGNKAFDDKSSTASYTLDWLKGHTKKIPLENTVNRPITGNTAINTDQFINMIAEDIARTVRFDLNSSTSFSRQFQTNWKPIALLPVGLDHGKMANSFDQAYAKWWTERLEPWLVKPFSQLILGQPTFAIANAAEEIGQSILGGTFSRRAWHLSADEFMDTYQWMNPGDFPLMQSLIAGAREGEMTKTLFNEPDVQNLIALRGQGAAKGSVHMVYDKQTGKFVEKKITKGWDAPTKGFWGTIFGGRYLEASGYKSADVRRASFLQDFYQRMKEAAPDLFDESTATGKVLKKYNWDQKAEMQLLNSIGLIKEGAKPEAVKAQLLSRWTSDTQQLKYIDDAISKADLPDELKEFLQTNIRTFKSPQAAADVIKTAINKANSDALYRLETSADFLNSVTDDLVNTLVSMGGTKPAVEDFIRSIHGITDLNDVMQKSYRHYRNKSALARYNLGETAEHEINLKGLVAAEDANEAFVAKMTDAFNKLQLSGDSRFNQPYFEHAKSVLAKYREVTESYYREMRAARADPITGLGKNYKLADLSQDKLDAWHAAEKKIFDKYEKDIARARHNLDKTFTSDAEMFFKRNSRKRQRDTLASHLARNPDEEGAIARALDDLDEEIPFMDDDSYVWSDLDSEPFEPPGGDPGFQYGFGGEFGGTPPMEGGAFTQPQRIQGFSVGDTVTSTPSRNLQTATGTSARPGRIKAFQMRPGGEVPGTEGIQRTVAGTGKKATGGTSPQNYALIEYDDGSEGWVPLRELTARKVELKTEVELSGDAAAKVMTGNSIRVSQPDGTVTTHAIVGGKKQGDKVVAKLSQPLHTEYNPRAKEDQIVNRILKDRVRQSPHITLSNELDKRIQQLAENSTAVGQFNMPMEEFYSKLEGIQKVLDGQILAGKWSAAKKSRPTNTLMKMRTTSDTLSEFLGRIQSLQKGDFDQVEQLINDWQTARRVFQDSPELLVRDSAIKTAAERGKPWGQLSDREKERLLRAEFRKMNPSDKTLERAVKPMREPPIGRPAGMPEAGEAMKADADLILQSGPMTTRKRVDGLTSKRQPGVRVGAQYDRATGQVLFDPGKLREQYNNRAWTKPRTLADGSKVPAMDADSFKSYQEWEDFVIEHEKIHGEISFGYYKTLSETGEKATLGEYEGSINTWALEKMKRHPKSAKRMYQSIDDARFPGNDVGEAFNPSAARGILFEELPDGRVQMIDTTQAVDWQGSLKPEYQQELKQRWARQSIAEWDAGIEAKIQKQLKAGKKSMPKAYRGLEQEWDNYIEGMRDEIYTEEWEKFLSSMDSNSMFSLREVVEAERERMGIEAPTIFSQPPSRVARRSAKTEGMYAARKAGAPIEEAPFSSYGTTTPSTAQPVSRDVRQRTEWNKGGFQPPFPGRAGDWPQQPRMPIEEAVPAEVPYKPPMEQYSFDDLNLGPDIHGGADINISAWQAFIIDLESEARRMAASMGSEIGPIRDMLRNQAMLHNYLQSDENLARFMREYNGLFEGKEYLLKNRDFTTLDDEVTRKFMDLLMTIDGIRQTKVINPELEEALGKHVDDFLAKAAKKPDLYETMKTAWADTTDNYHKWFTNYDGGGTFDRVMQHVFPFWRYEKQRWPRLARDIRHHPWIATDMYRATQASGDGYIEIPGTGLRFNPAAGTMYGSLRTAMQDGGFFYEHRPGAWGKLDQFIQLTGFYPGPQVTAPLALKEGHLGEAMPTAFENILNAGEFGASVLPGGEGIARGIQTARSPFHSRYRENAIAAELANMGIHPYEATEEQRIEAEHRVAGRSGVRGLTGGMLKDENTWRREQMESQWEAARQAGIPEEIIQEARRRGKNPLMADTEGDPWDYKDEPYLNRSERRRIEEQNPEWEKLAAVRESFVGGEREKQGRLAWTTGQQVRGLEQDVENRLKLLSASFQMGEISGEQFRDKRAKLMDELRGAYELRGRTFDAMRTEPKSEGGVKAREDQLASEYYSIQAPIKQNGMEDFDALEKMQANFVRQNNVSESELQYILEEYPRQRWHDPLVLATEGEYDEAKALNKQYYDLPKYPGMSEDEAMRADKALQLAEQVRGKNPSMSVLQSLAVVARYDSVGAQLARRALTIKKRVGDRAPRTQFRKSQPLWQKYYG